MEQTSPSSPPSSDFSNPIPDPSDTPQPTTNPQDVKTNIPLRVVSIISGSSFF